LLLLPPGPDDDDDDDSVEREKLLDASISDVSLYNSSVTRIIGKFLILIDSYQPPDILTRRNYEVLTDVLRSFLRLGKEEEEVLLKLGGVYRIICSAIVLHPIHLRMPFRECLRSAVDVVCALMQSAKLPPAISFSLPDMKSENEVCFLNERDLRAFMSRMFLENTLNITHPNGVQANSVYSMNFLAALQNVSDQLPADRVIKFLGFFMDKVFEGVATTPPRTKDTNDQIELAFNVLSKLIVHVLESLMQLGKSNSEYYLIYRDRAEHIIDQVLSWIISKTCRICNRRSPADSEFICQVMKLLYRIGFQSELGFKIVMKMKEQWRSFSTVFCGEDIPKIRNVKDQQNGSTNDNVRRNGQMATNKLPQQPHR